MTHRRNIIIGDCHGRPDLITNALRHANYTVDYDRLIFCGDVVDIGFEPEACLDILLENKAELLWGNHDLAIVINKQIWPQSSYYDNIQERLIACKDSFKVATTCGNILVTHAGVPKTMINVLGVSGIDEICKSLNLAALEGLWRNDGPFWYRPSIENPPVFRQVFGHTPPCWIPDSIRNACSVEPYVEVGFGPGRYRYAVIENNVVTIHDSNV